MAMEEPVFKKATPNGLPILYHPIDKFNLETAFCTVLFLLANGANLSDYTLRPISQYSGNEQSINLTKYEESTYSKNMNRSKMSGIGNYYKLNGEAIIKNINNSHVKPTRLDQEELKWIIDRVYTDFIQYLDAKITGVALWSVNNKKPVINPRQVYSTDNWYLDSLIKYTPQTKEGFEDVVQTLSGVFERFVKYLTHTHLPSKSKLIKAYQRMLNGNVGVFEDLVEKIDPSAVRKVLVLDEFITWKDHLMTYERTTDGVVFGNCLFVVYPDSSGEWRIAGVPARGNFKLRRKVSGKLKFLHSNGFIGGDTREKCLKCAHESAKG
ncbi:hypothetical protein DAMA08_028270 [Martiniozyma asiatica (nom. inval.)]|nr:hypothetical protein DAMA08_028270 [Martiniozyma asiatica]